MVSSAPAEPPGAGRPGGPARFVARSVARFGAGSVARVVVAIVGVALVATGCGRTESGDQPVAVDASAYAALIEAFLPPAVDPDVRQVVYVAQLGPESLPLELQVAVIEVFDDEYDIRFVDDLAAALDGTDDREPRDDAVVLGVAPIKPDRPHTARVEVYTASDRIEAHLVTLAVRSGSWQVATDELVEPEVLVGDE